MRKFWLVGGFLLACFIGAAVVAQSSESDDTPLKTFPMFKDNAWKTGADVSKAPVQWLYAGATNGHASHGHALVLRWRAHAAGEVRMVGTIKRTQKGGAVLAWHTAGPDGKAGKNNEFPPESEARIDAPWTTVKAGDTLDFVLRAPTSSNCGGVSWNLRILGRESAADGVQEIGNIRKDFPHTNDAPPLPPSGNPWADFAQALLASNEFHFIH